MPESFAALGLEPNATPEEVKAAWRNAARILHPDLGGDAAKFDELHSQYLIALEQAEANAADCPVCHGTRVQTIVNGFSSINLPCERCAL